MTQYIRITEKTLRWFQPLLPPEETHLLTRGQAFYAIGAVQDRIACGVLVFQAGPQLADIRYLAVADDYRRQGIATGMVDYLCQHAKASITPVICTFAAASLRDPVYLFFAELDGFSVAQEDGFYCQVPLAGLAQRPALSAARGRGLAVRPFFSLPRATQRSFLLQLQRQGVYFLREIPQDRYCRPLCLCCIGAEDIEAAVFVAQGEREQDLELVCVWCAPNRHQSLIGLLAEACAQLPSTEDGMLRIAAVTPVSAAIVDKLLPQRQITARFYQAAWDMDE